MARVEDSLTQQRQRGSGTSIPGTRTLGVKVRRLESLIELVRAGFAFEHLAMLEEKSGLTRQRVAEMVAIPTRTLARRQKEGHLSSEESDRLLRAARLFEMTENLFEGSCNEARQWLLKPNPALGGECPLSMAATDVGAREVEGLIGRLEHGVFV